MQGDSSGSLALRAATEADLRAVVELEQQPDNERFIVAWPLARHAAAMADADFRYLIIEADRMVVGFVLVAGLAGVACDRIELRRIVVGKKGAGIGRQALQQLLAWAFATQSVELVWLDVFGDNARALHLYQSIGFQVVEVQESVKASRTLVIMEITREAYAARASVANES